MYMAAFIGFVGGLFVAEILLRASRKAFRSVALQDAATYLDRQARHFECMPGASGIQRAKALYTAAAGLRAWSYCPDDGPVKMPEVP